MQTFLDKVLLRIRIISPPHYRGLCYSSSEYFVVVKRVETVQYVLLNRCCSLTQCGYSRTLRVSEAFATVERATLYGYLWLHNLEVEGGFIAAEVYLLRDFCMLVPHPLTLSPNTYRSLFLICRLVSLLS
jgi:hypothetical protein